MPVTSLARDRETAEVRSSSEANTEIIFLPAVCNVGWCGRVERFRENAREEGWLGGYWSTPVISTDGRLSEADYSELMVPYAVGTLLSRKPDPLLLNKLRFKETKTRTREKENKRGREREKEREIFYSLYTSLVSS